MSFFGGHISFSDCCCLLRGYFTVFIISKYLFCFLQTVTLIIIFGKDTETNFYWNRFPFNFCGTVSLWMGRTGSDSGDWKTAILWQKIHVTRAIMSLIKGRETSHQCNALRYLFDQIWMYLVTHHGRVFLTPCVMPIYVSGFLMTHIPKAPSGHFWTFSSRDGTFFDATPHLFTILTCPIQIFIIKQISVWGLGSGVTYLGVTETE